MKNIVGISGQLGSGKDTAADRLIMEFGLVKVALADPIKRYGLRVFNFTEEQLWGPSEFRNAPDPRFTRYDGPHDGDDGWMAVFRRAEEFDGIYVKELFAGDPLKQAMVKMHLRQWRLDLAENHPKLSPRIMLQSLGTEWGRAVKSDLWITHAITTSERLLAGGILYDRAAGLIESDGSAAPPGVVISDVRFHNELDYIKKAQGFLIRIKRPSTDAQATGTGIQGHASEREQQSFEDSDFNYVINNAGTLEAFITAIDVAGYILTGSEE